MRKRRRNPPIRSRRPAHRPSMRAHSLTNRVSARDTVIMAAVAVAFIAAFAFALSKPAPHTPSAALQAMEQTDIPAASQPEPMPASPEPNTLASTASRDADFVCDDARITDGDTLRCGALRVRLASIDAPEMPGHCRRGRTCVDGDPYASKANLERLVAGGVVQCRQTDTDRYGRIVAFCAVGGRDLSCAQVQGGHAIIRYGDLACPAR